MLCQQICWKSFRWGLAFPRNFLFLRGARPCRRLRRSAARDSWVPSGIGPTTTGVQSFSASQHLTRRRASPAPKTFWLAMIWAAICITCSIPPALHVLNSLTYTWTCQMKSIKPSNLSSNSTLAPHLAAPRRSWMDLRERWKKNRKLSVPNIDSTGYLSNFNTGNVVQLYSF